MSLVKTAEQIASDVAAYNRVHGIVEEALDIPEPPSGQPAKDLLAATKDHPDRRVARAHTKAAQALDVLEAALWDYQTREAEIIRQATAREAALAEVAAAREALQQAQRKARNLGVRPAGRATPSTAAVKSPAQIAALRSPAMQYARTAGINRRYHLQGKHQKPRDNCALCQGHDGPGEAVSMVLDDEVLVERLRSLVRTGHSDSQIADELGVTARSIVRWRKQLNIPGRPTGVTVAHAGQVVNA